MNPAPGGGSSAAASVAVNNPVPGAITLTPGTVLVGSSSPTTVTVSGTNFISTSTVQIGGSNRSTTFVSGTRLTFQLTVADQATAGHLSVTVVTPAPGGGTSAAVSLTVGNPAPTPIINQVQPTQFYTGSAVSYIYVSGYNFTAASFVQWNGSPLASILLTDPYFGIYLEATVPASLLAAKGTATITVSTPTAPSISTAVSVSIVDPPPPTLTSLSPASAPINTSTVVTLNGTGFTSSSTVAFNGVNVTPTFVNTNQLTVTLSASLAALPGNGNFTVTTPAPGGGTTAPLAFTSYIGINNNSMIYNPANGLFYVSVPSSAGAPYGNSVVSVDPETGALGTPINVGSEPNKLALSSDGTILWVGLDGASAVRQVNLSTNSAGRQFPLLGSIGNGGAVTALALAALPGSPNSVVVSSTSGYANLSLAIYDNGTIRGSSTPGAYNSSSAYALQVDGARSEIYAAGSNYNTYTYSATGLTAKAVGTTYSSYASSTFDEMQLAGSRIYTDFGKVLDPESGSLLGTFFSTGATVAAGPTFADTTLGKVFILDSSSQNFYGYNQIQVFNASDYTATSSVIPISVTSSYNVYPSRLARWGSNGLAFRTPAGVYSLRSNLVKDLSSTSADLGVTLAASGANTTGSNSTYTATVTNAGPSAATNVALTAMLPSTGVLVSATPSVGTCSTAGAVTCDLGSLANAASATVTLVVQQTAAGSSALTVQVSASENDPTTSNNQATSTLSVTGSTYNFVPVLASISPSSIQTGAMDTTITVTGSAFSSGAIVNLGGSALTTSYTSASSLTATVPAAKAATLGWAPVTVSNPSPGGGSSAALPLSFYSVLTLGVNHILYDPYTRNIMASVSSGSSAVTGNSIVAITPDTATIGTPVSIGAAPGALDLTSDGQLLYATLPATQSVARFNMLTQQPDFTVAIPTPAGAFGTTLQGVTAQPGTENTVVLDLGSYSGNAIYDFNASAHTVAIRGQNTGIYGVTCSRFLSAGTLLANDGGSTLYNFPVTSAGFAYFSTSQYTTSTFSHFGCFKLSNGLAYSVAGAVANPVSPAVELGSFPLPSTGYGNTNSNNVAPDASLGKTFFAVNSSNNYSTSFDSIEAFDNITYLPSASIPLAFSRIEGSTCYTVPDLIRWGQDGIAVLSSGGHIYLLRGAAVVPQLLTQNTAASLTSSSSTSVTHGAGNTLLTLTGTNFIPGIAVQWNGSYRTTTIVDPTHVTVAIPASDLSTAGTASLKAINPGAPASSTLTFTIN